jgi:hypothetical protein
MSSLRGHGSSLDARLAPWLGLRRDGVSRVQRTTSRLAIHAAKTTRMEASPSTRYPFTILLLINANTF